MIIDGYLQQTVTRFPATGTNAAGETTHGPAESIEVRWYHEVKLIRDDDGRETVSSAHVSTKTPVGNKDLITDENGRDREVMTVRTNRDVDGTFSHYVAFLK